MDKLMLIANPAAGAVSPRVKSVIEKALAADFKLEVTETRGRNHASELARDAVDRDFDAVVTLGGDGTVNETAQGLVGSRVALAVLPGGTTNVLARSLGVPRNVVEATGYVAELLRERVTHRINVGKVNGRYFLFCGGFGFDAEVVRRVEQNPEAKRRRGEWLFLQEALRIAFTRLRGKPPAITLEVPGEEPAPALLAVFANARPFTYFRGWAVDACPHARLDEGLDVWTLSRVGAVTIPRIAWAVLVSRSHVTWRNATYHHDLSSFTLTSPVPLQVQVDGDTIGAMERLEVSLVPDALEVVSEVPESPPAR